MVYLLSLRSRREERVSQAGVCGGSQERDRESCTCLCVCACVRVFVVSCIDAAWEALAVGCCENEENADEARVNAF